MAGIEFQTDLRWNDLYAPLANRAVTEPQGRMSKLLSEVTARLTHIMRKLTLYLN
ncbi:MAG TPA: hypothetical protein VF918_14170 [Anaerolineales bacterium]